MKKRIFIYCSLLLIVVIGFVAIGIYGKQPTTSPKPEAPKPNTTASLTYVSLGDSIPEGYGLTGTKDTNGFVEGSYTHSLKTTLEGLVEDVYSVNYATAGNTSTNLLDTLITISGTNLSAENQQIKNNIQNADIITICIGANDILGPAQSNLFNFLIQGTDITPYLDAGLQTFTNNFPLILSNLQTLNPTAKLVFSNIYNPYKEFINTTNSLTLSVGGLMSYSLTSAQLQSIGYITEVYLDSGNLLVGTETKTITNGINQIIENTINNQTNCYLLDVKESFDMYYTNNKKYDIVKTDVLSQSTISVALATMEAELLAYLDPHPTTLGHHQIATILNALYSNFY